jgi:hypothetical protein
MSREFSFAKLTNKGPYDTLLYVALLMVVGGGWLAWTGFRDVRLAGVAQVEPSTLSCRELAENGPGGNAHVQLTGFRLLTHSFVVEETESSRIFDDVSQRFQSKSRPPEKHWSRAWFPAVPADGEYVKRLDAAPDDRPPPLPDLRVIVQTGGGSDRSLDALEREKVLTGTIVNVIESLDGKVERLLSGSYPGIDFDRCWILEVGRIPEMPRFGWLRLVSGVLILGGGGALLFLMRHLSKGDEQARVVSERRRQERYRKRRRRLAEP